MHGAEKETVSQRDWNILQEIGCLKSICRIAPSGLTRVVLNEKVGSHDASSAKCIKYHELELERGGPLYVSARKYRANDVSTLRAMK